MTTDPQQAEFERRHNWRLSRKVSTDAEAVRIGIAQAEKFSGSEVRDYDRVIFGSAALAQHRGIDVTPKQVHQYALGSFTLSLKPDQITVENLKLNVMQDLKRSFQTNRPTWDNAQRFSTYWFPTYNPKFGEQSAEQEFLQFLKDNKIRRNTKRANEAAERNKIKLAAFVISSQKAHADQHLSEIRRGIDRNRPIAESQLRDANTVLIAASMAKKLGATDDDIGDIVTGANLAKERATNHLDFLNNAIVEREKIVADLSGDKRPVESRPSPDQKPITDAEANAAGMAAFEAGQSRKPGDHPTFMKRVQDTGFSTVVKTQRLKQFGFGFDRASIEKEKEVTTKENVTLRSRSSRVNVIAHDRSFPKTGSTTQRSLDRG